MLLAVLLVAGLFLAGAVYGLCVCCVESFQAFRRRLKK